MPKGKSLSPQDIISIIEAYNKTKSVWKAAAITGFSGQAIHTTLRKLDLIQYPNFSEAEIEEIKIEYSKDIKDFSLLELSKRLGRDKTGICAIAKTLGLTTKEHIKQSGSEKLKAINVPGRWSKGNHPKGMLGKTHTEQTKQKMSEKSKENAASLTEEEAKQIKNKMVKTKMQKYGTAAPGFANSINAYSRTKKGKREDLGETYFRSSWEANYARYLNLLIENKTILKWEFEPDTFIFSEVTRGPKSYLPDFKVWLLDNTIEYHEIKGWMDAKSKSKIKKMIKYYPNISLVLIDSKKYKAIEKQYKTSIVNWE